MPILSQSHTYQPAKALDPATLASQSAPRPMSGIGADLFALGTSFMRPAMAPQVYDVIPSPEMLADFDARDRRGAAGC